MAEFNKEQIRASIFGLTIECPYYTSNLMDCQLFEIRKLSPSQRVEFVENLSEKECIEIYERHKVCLEINKSHQFSK